MAVVNANFTAEQRYRSLWRPDGLRSDWGIQPRALLTLWVGGAILAKGGGDETHVTITAQLDSNYCYRLSDGMMALISDDGTNNFDESGVFRITAPFFNSKTTDQWFAEWHNQHSSFVFNNSGGAGDLARVYDLENSVPGILQAPESTSIVIDSLISDVQAGASAVTSIKYMVNFLVYDISQSDKSVLHTSSQVSMPQ